MAEYIRQLSVKDVQGNDCSMGDLLKQVTLIVNVDCKVEGDANSACSNLQTLYDKYRDRGFEILAFPCDQFQVSHNRFCTAAEVKQDLAKRYGVTFPILNRVNVNGETAHPLFVFLQKRLHGFGTDAIKWDFTKFLVVNGEPKKRYAPSTPARMLEMEIAEELGVPLPTEETTSSIKQGLQTVYQQGKQETAKMQESIMHGLQTIGITKPKSSGQSSDVGSEQPAALEDLSRPSELDQTKQQSIPQQQIEQQGSGEQTSSSSSSSSSSESRSELQNEIPATQEISQPPLAQSKQSIGQSEAPRPQSLQSQIQPNQSQSSQYPESQVGRQGQGSEWNRGNTDTPQIVAVTESIRQVELSNVPGLGSSDRGSDNQSGNLRLVSKPQVTVTELTQSVGTLHDPATDYSSDRI